MIHPIDRRNRKVSIVAMSLRSRVIVVGRREDRLPRVALTIRLSPRLPAISRRAVSHAICEEETEFASLLRGGWKRKEVGLTAGLAE